MDYRAAATRNLTPASSTPSIAGVSATSLKKAASQSPALTASTADSASIPKGTTTSGTATSSGDSSSSSSDNGGIDKPDDVLDAIVGVAVEIKTYPVDGEKGLSKRDDAVVSRVDIIAMSQIESIKVLSVKDATELANVELPKVEALDVRTVMDRHDSALRDAYSECSRIGIGVTAEGQQIFDALRKTLPCRWHEKQIIVLDEVLIDPPYSPSDCKANPSSANLLQRVRKVLQGERARLGQS
ncbi:hypothetical protein EV182_001786 [Spiromyces aspiralis]|uniref:Uncharacterized protein n=1 Tax=Spiromyces aspiralis TaxID=68401 RepID=A0ACC1HFD5_9FUNG|nr:hypothetical protein EV182_001786 [Spiromyces aspiralis]